MKAYEQNMIAPRKFDTISHILRSFYRDHGFLETFVQSRLSILAACEDPSTVRSFKFDGTIYPMTQTGQMWLEHDLLKYNNPVYCWTTSYRDEATPIPGRHDKVFPMSEFEMEGDFEDLISLLEHLCRYIGFKEIKRFTYDELCQYYQTDILTSEHEEKMWKDIGDVVVIEKFPIRTSPFWNMKESDIPGIYNKADFIICGQETFGSAQRSIDVAKMRKQFHTISDGEYAQLLYDQFTKERVEEELEDYLALNMFERFGGGIGITRLLRAMTLKGLL